MEQIFYLHWVRTHILRILRVFWCFSGKSLRSSVFWAPMPSRLEFPIRVGGCITLHTPRPPTFRSEEYVAGNRRGKSEASERANGWERKTFLVDLDRFRRGKRVSGGNEARSNEARVSHCLLTIITKFALARIPKTPALFPGPYHGKFTNIILLDFL